MDYDSASCSEESAASDASPAVAPAVTEAPAPRPVSRFPRVPLLYGPADQPLCRRVENTARVWPTKFSVERLQRQLELQSGAGKSGELGERTRCLETAISTLRCRLPAGDSRCQQLTQLQSAVDALKKESKFLEAPENPDDGEGEEDIATWFRFARQQEKMEAADALERALAAPPPDAESRGVAPSWIAPAAPREAG
mmetsp:Transcript_8329/g.19931  ORF Transcript_8329/g.19931 Transcript_8329/m.19931 type:complete len:197 (+) Transcript_8329:26-616(+)